MTESSNIGHSGTVAAYRTGTPIPDEAAVVTKHLELVKRIAWHLMARLPASVDVDDLVQAGVLGLIEAARNFNGERGATFETYAGIRIRGAMVDELRRSDWAPRSVHRRMRDVTLAIRQIEQETGGEAHEAQIIERMGVDATEYREIVRDAAQCQVLSTSVQDDEQEDAYTVDAVDGEATPDRAVEDAAFRDALAAAITMLPKRERLVMSLYYDDELNLREIGEVLEVTESRVCQLHGQALLRLRAKLVDWGTALPAPGGKRTPRGRPLGNRPVSPTGEPAFLN